MHAKTHWESVYSTRAPEETSWYRPHLDISLVLIEQLTPSHSASIIDVGAGASTLVDDLVQRGYTNLTVLDISESALCVAKKRLGPTSSQIQWLTEDVCEANLPFEHYDLWHDRAVFHFLTLPEERTAYVARAEAAVKRNGHLIISTFGQEGPTRCSGLDTVRYDAVALEAHFSSQFILMDTRIEWHTTPSGGRQQFLYCAFKRV